MIEIKHIDHVALTVTDIDRSVRWYTEVLGFEHRYPGLWDGVPAMLFVGETGLALFPAKGTTPASGDVRMQHLAFRVNRSGFEKAQVVLRERGIAFKFQDHLISHSIYFDDPDGHDLEITTYDVGG